MKTLLRYSLTALVACAAFSQVVPKPPAFEVADVQCSKPDAKPARPRFLPGGRVDLHGITLKLMIMAAYGVQDDLVIGGPAWLDADRFDVVAKAPPDTPDATLYLMLRTLLAERFHLAIHNEDKSLPAYALTVVKPALLKAAAGSGQPDCAWQEGAPGRIRRVCHNISMSGTRAPDTAVGKSQYRPSREGSDRNHRSLRRRTGMEPSRRWRRVKPALSCNSGRHAPRWTQAGTAQASHECPCDRSR